MQESKKEELIERELRLSHQIRGRLREIDFIGLGRDVIILTD